MKYQIYKTSEGFFRWRLKAGNGEIIASGEAYYNKADCQSVINLVKGSGSAPTEDLT